MYSKSQSVGEGQWTGVQSKERTGVPSPGLNFPGSGSQFYHVSFVVLVTVC